MKSLKIAATVAKALVGCAAVLIGAVHPARADEVLYDGSGFMRGQQSFEDTFNVSGPGVLTVTLSNFDWPQPLASLDLVMSSQHGLLGPEMGAGTAMFTVASGGIVSAQWFGTAQGPLDAGVFGLKVDFAPTVVPLPASIALLLSGLALLAFTRREQGRVPQPAVE